MTHKLLIIAPRLPDTGTNKGMHDFFSLMRDLARSFDVSFLFIQSMFAREDAIREISEAGIRVIPVSSLRQRKDASFEDELKRVSGAEKFDFILFNTHYTAKYYLPYLADASRESVIVMDGSCSLYVSGMRYARESRDRAARANALKSAELNKMKEIAVYHDADVVLVNNDADRDELRKDIPRVDVRVLPKCAADGSGEIGAFFSSFKKKSPGAYTPGNTPTARILGESAGGSISLPERFNCALREVSDEFTLLVPPAVEVPERSFERLLLCAQSHPRYGIVVPLSNLNSGVFGTRDLGPIFLMKHYFANFGYWREVRRLDGACMLIRRQVRDSIGLLDRRFETMHYALFDYCIRAFQAGFTTMLVNEAFVIYQGSPADESAGMEKDRVLLYRKWCDAGTEYLEGLQYPLS